MAGTVKAVVIDANLTVALLTQLPYSERTVQLVREWRMQRVSLYAPILWEYELATALRKMVAAATLNLQQADVLLGRLQAIGVKRIAPDLALHQQALRWAGRLGQYAAYDAQYLALAERLGAEFWTADKSMIERARQEGVDWVRGVTA